ncbi:hypothetical protein [Xanthomonas arboricola]|uniref:hypothetical protein n=1 Tax=Xanthomonas arboricola TaxID=56448 RepID=UPI000C865A1B|nr:hypothetical protein [Xanthomonas arboricola]PPU29500.1 hypothetical protein XarCFBP6762_03415 [Xanthomonas arboricola]
MEQMRKASRGSQRGSTQWPRAERRIHVAVDADASTSLRVCLRNRTAPHNENGAIAAIDCAVGDGDTLMLQTRSIYAIAAQMPADACIDSR